MVVQQRYLDRMSRRIAAWDRAREDIMHVQNLLYLTDPMHIQGTNLVVVDVAEGALVIQKGRAVCKN